MTEAVGRQAALIERFWWFTFWSTAAVFVLVMVALAWAVWHRRDGIERTDRTLGRGVIVAVVATAGYLFVYLVLDLVTGRALVGMERENALSIRVTGHQWWWEIEYEDSLPSRRLLTANELHIPVGRPVRIELASTDVIHSLWMPRLHGKRDLVPGRTNEIWIRADSAGVWEGQCAEFCGHQHANMRLVVVAEESARFQRWYDAQLQPALPPATVLAGEGLHVFLTRQCVMCHAVRGTQAGGRVAPDLTHIASRLTIAAGTLPNTRGHMAGWIVDPQRIKPGVRMPPNPMTPGEQQALLAYLEGLR